MDASPTPAGTTLASMEAQLRSLYAEREKLFTALGTADADTLIALVRSLEAQLVELYADRAAAFQAVEAREAADRKP